MIQIHSVAVSGKLGTYIDTHIHNDEKQKFLFFLSRLIKICLKNFVDKIGNRENKNGTIKYIFPIFVNFTTE